MPSSKPGPITKGPGKRPGRNKQRAPTQPIKATKAASASAAFRAPSVGRRKAITAEQVWGRKGSCWAEIRTLPCLPPAQSAFYHRLEHGLHLFYACIIRLIYALTCVGGCASLHVHTCSLSCCPCQSLSSLPTTFLITHWRAPALSRLALPATLQRQGQSERKRKASSVDDDAGATGGKRSKRSPPSPASPAPASRPAGTLPAGQEVLVRGA
jgi:hypothetical protein